MQWWTAASVVFITCFSATVNAQAGCDACLCTDADGDVWDLTDLGGPQTVVGPPQSSLYGDWNYHWDICATVTPPPPPLCTAVTTTVAYRLEDYPGTGALCQQLGPASPSLLTVTKIDGDADNGVQLVFSHNTYTMTLNVACDESLRNQDPVFTPPTSGAAAIEIGWASFYACPGHQAVRTVLQTQCVAPTGPTRAIFPPSPLVVRCVGYSNATCRGETARGVGLS